MTNTLWTFGSSNTAPFTANNAYTIWKGYIPKIWPEVIAEKLEYELKNLAIAACDNYTIFETICSVSNQIKENDVIIIGWTHPVRFRLVAETDNKNWTYILSTFDKKVLNKFENKISENTLIEILCNRQSKEYSNEVDNWTKLINKAFTNNKVIHWSEFITSQNIEMIINCERISFETKGLIEDYHFSEKGNYDLAQIIMNSGKLLKKTNLI